MSNELKCVIEVDQVRIDLEIVRGTFEAHVPKYLPRRDELVLAINYVLMPYILLQSNVMLLNAAGRAVDQVVKAYVASLTLGEELAIDKEVSARNELADTIADHLFGKDK